MLLNHIFISLNWKNLQIGLLWLVLLRSIFQAIKVTYLRQKPDLITPLISYTIACYLPGRACGF